MRTPSEYINRTESAMRKLFDGIDSYISIIQIPPVFGTCYSDQVDFDAKYATWAEEHADEIESAKQANQEYFEESFALAILCGSALQVAAKAIECYSSNEEVPQQDFSSMIATASKTARFCIGREIRGVPLGLIIYAGRNQHIHFEDAHLREPSLSVFKKLAENQFNGITYTDPAFDLTNDDLVSFSSNIISLIGWRDFDSYRNDICKLLSIS